MSRTRESIRNESIELNRKIVQLMDAGQNAKSVAKKVGRSVSTVYGRYQSAKWVNMRRQEKEDEKPGSLRSLGLSQGMIRRIRISTKASEKIRTLIDLQRFIETNPEWRTIIYTKKQLKDPENQKELQELEEFARNHGIRIIPIK